MATIATTYQTYQIKGIREQLSNLIYNIAPTDTPFMSNAGTGDKLENTFFEWQTDDLAAAVATNAQIEGDDVTTFEAATPTVRMGNYTQISRKEVIISDTAEVVNKAGRKSELAYQVSKRGSEIKRDIEKKLLANKAAVAGAAGTARETASILAFIKTNVDKAAGGVNPVYTTLPNDVRTDGTPRAFTETMLKNAVQLQWNEGGKADTILVNGSQKVAISAFAGIATATFNQSTAKPSTIIGAADVYVSDFGTLYVVADRFMRSTDALILDFDLISLRYLRPFKTVPLAKTGDAEKRMLLAEFGLQVNQEKGLALVTDLS